MNAQDKEFIVNKIRSEYTEKQYGELNALKALDKKAKRPASVFAWTFGSLSAIVMGAGMSLVMTDISSKLSLPSPMAAGIVIGIVGMIGAIANYPIYKRLLASGRKKYAPEIIRLSDSIVKK